MRTKAKGRKCWRCKGIRGGGAVLSHAPCTRCGVILHSGCGSPDKLCRACAEETNCCYDCGNPHIRTSPEGEGI